MKCRPALFLCRSRACARLAGGPHPTAAAPASSRRVRLFSAFRRSLVQTLAFHLHAHLYSFHLGNSFAQGRRSSGRRCSRMTYLGLLGPRLVLGCRRRRTSGGPGRGRPRGRRRTVEVVADNVALAVGHLCGSAGTESEAADVDAGQTGSSAILFEPRDCAAALSDVSQTRGTWNHQPSGRGCRFVVQICTS